jgi:hypothetical protein
LIDLILKEDQENNVASQERGRNCDKDSLTGVFDNVSFSPQDWKDLNALNQELQIYKELTKKMEGDSPTLGALVIPKYLELKELLEEKIEMAKEAETLYPFLTEMLKRVQKYLKEAMQCETLILANIVHPCFCLHIFKLGFGVNGVESKHCLNLFKTHFKNYQDLLKSLEKETSCNNIQVIPNPSEEHQTSCLMICLATCVTKNTTSVAEKIGNYLKIQMNSKEFNVKNFMMPLKWWKAHLTTFPTITFLAQDYLGCVESSFAQLNTFFWLQWTSAPATKEVYSHLLCHNA